MATVEQLKKRVADDPSMLQLIDELLHSQVNLYQIIGELNQLESILLSRALVIDELSVKCNSQIMRELSVAMIQIAITIRMISSGGDDQEEPEEIFHDLMNRIQQK